MLGYFKFYLSEIFRQIFDVREENSLYRTFLPLLLLLLLFL
jgi:hypothetical protein